MLGQTFQPTQTGWLTGLTVARCPASSTKLTVRKVIDPSTPLSGHTLFTSEASPAVSLDATCTPGPYTTSIYPDITFSVPENTVALIQGTTYSLVFEQGFGSMSCDDDPYDLGEAFGLYGPVSDKDLNFQIHICVDEAIVVGCADSSSNICNYDPLAHADDGSCTELDCAGVCGGEATIVEGCGCVGGSTGIMSDHCFGCTDSEACNFQPDSPDLTLYPPPIDDGSCLYDDCNGDCNGSAYLTDCGCLGGNSELQGSCIDGCITETYGKNEDSCSPVFLGGSSFSIDTTGFIKRIAISGCCALPLQFQIRRTHIEFECNSSEYWNQGELIFESEISPPSCNGFTACFGPQGYEFRHFDVPNLPILSGAQYFIVLTEGVGAATCTPPSFSNTAYSIHGQPSAQALHWELDVCPNDEVFGCPDENAANYSSSALVNDESCEYVDCAGELNGNHVFLAGCGCIPNDDSQAAISCFDGEEVNILESHSQDCPTLTSERPFQLNENGYITGLQIQVDSTETFSLEIRIDNGPYADSTIFQYTHAGKTPIPSCAPHNTGWVFIPLDSLPVQAQQHYRLTSNQTVLVGSCNSPNLLYANGQSPSQNLANIRLAYQVAADDEMQWGCQSMSACNFNPFATHDSGECYVHDCLGQCPDIPDYQEAYFIEGCGCVGGPDSLLLLTPSQCTGCMEPEACNFNPIAVTQSLGACNFPDCNGDCLATDPTQTGLATLDPVCGCIGGNTGTGDEDLCNARCQGETIVSNFPETPAWTHINLDGAYQYITLDHATHLTGIKLLQVGTLPPPDAPPLTIELLAGSTSNINEATSLGLIEPKLFTPSNLPNLFGLSNIYFDIENTPFINEEDILFIRLVGQEWACPSVLNDNLPYAGSYASDAGTTELNDFCIELIGCDDLFGCNDPSACNYEPWATQLAPNSCIAVCTDVNALNYEPSSTQDCINNAYCEYLMGCGDPAACNYVQDALSTHPYTLEQIECFYPDSTLCLYCPSDIPSGDIDSIDDLPNKDLDNDGICDDNEVVGCTDPDACNYNINATDIGLCIFPNECTECSGAIDGTGTIIAINDVDNDNICDDLDLCIDITANNYADPANKPCRGPCDSAPIFDAIHYTSLASGRASLDGKVHIAHSIGYLEGLTDVDFWPHRIEFEGLNGSANFSFLLAQEEPSISPGFYLVTLYDDQNCPSVQGHSHGSTFNQPVQQHTFIMPYELCCGGCSIYDQDTDGICDSSDNCTDRQAANYADPNNTPCIYSE